MAIPSLVLKSMEISGLFKVNGAPVGVINTGEDVITLPVPPNGELLLEFVPLQSPQSHYLPLYTRFSLENPQVSPCFTLFKWPQSVYEILAQPPKVMAGSTRLPAVMKQFPFTLQGDVPCEALLLRSDQLYLIIEDGATAHVLLDMPLGEDEDAEMSCQGGYLLIKSPNYITVIARWHGKMTCLLHTQAHEADLQGQELCLHITLPDTMGHLVTCIYDLSVFPPEKKSETFGLLQKRKLTTPQEMVYAFFEALHLEQEEEAMSYLSEGLKTVIQYDDLIAFFGNFDAITPYHYPVTAMAGIPVGLLYPCANNIPDVRLFFAEYIEPENSVGEYKIDNITEP